MKRSVALCALLTIALLQGCQTQPQRRYVAAADSYEARLAAHETMRRSREYTRIVQEQALRNLRNEYR